VAWLATLVLLLVGWRAVRSGDVASENESAKSQRLTRISSEKPKFPNVT
jgi:hypothetical protein